MNTDLFTKAVVPVVGMLTPIVAALVFYWTYLRLHVRQLEILDKSL